MQLNLWFNLLLCLAEPDIPAQERALAHILQVQQHGLKVVLCVLAVAGAIYMAVLMCVLYAAVMITWERWKRQKGK